MARQKRTSPLRPNFKLTWPSQAQTTFLQTCFHTEMLDANLLVIPRAHNQRTRTRHLCFTITVSPRLIGPGAMDFDPSAFPTPTSDAVHVRALIHRGALAAGISKNLPDTTPQLSISLSTQAQTEFHVSIKHQSNAAPDQEKHSKWLEETKRNKIENQVPCRQTLHPLAQRLTSLRQRIVPNRLSIFWSKNSTSITNFCLLKQRATHRLQTLRSLINSLHRRSVKTCERSSSPTCRSNQQQLQTARTRNDSLIQSNVQSRPNRSHGRL